MTVTEMPEVGRNGRPKKYTESKIKEIFDLYIGENKTIDDIAIELNLNASSCQDIIRANFKQFILKFYTIEELCFIHENKLDVVQEFYPNMKRNFITSLKQHLSNMDIDALNELQPLVKRRCFGCGVVFMVDKKELLSFIHCDKMAKEIAKTNDAKNRIN